MRFFGIDDRVVAYVCANVSTAQEVERLMKIEGFSIEAKEDEKTTKNAGNGAVKDTVIVYLLKKGKMLTRK